MTARTRAHRLPRYRPSPGQTCLFDPAILNRARQEHPTALRFIPTATGRPLALIQGGARPEPAAPAVTLRRVAA